MSCEGHGAPSSIGAEQSSRLTRSACLLLLCVCSLSSQDWYLTKPLNLTLLKEVLLLCAARRQIAQQQEHVSASSTEHV